MRCRILKSRALSSALFTATLVFAGTAQAATRVTFESKGACPSEAESLTIDGSRFRSDTSVEGQGTSLLYDGAERLMITLMHDVRQYMQTEVDEDALDYQGDVADSTGNYMNKQMEKMETQMAQQCAEMRKQGMDCPQVDIRGMMQGMVNNQMPAWRDLDREGESAGIGCRWWERTQGGVRIKEECSAKVGDLPIGERDRRGLERGIKVMQRYGSNMQGMMQGLTGDAAQQSGLPQDGLVIAEVCYGADGKEIGRVTAKFVEATVDAKLFETPAGYSQMSMSEATQ